MSDALELLRRAVTPALYREIRELWKAHSIAEDRRDIRTDRPATAALP